MSMLNAAAPYRRDDHQTMRVPVVLPLVEVDVDRKGYLTVTLDREPYSADESLTREDLKPVLSDIATDLRTPIRVEVHEADDSTFIDIITPRRPAAETVRPAERPALASAFGISGDGFSAGEQVEVCVVVARQIADGDGTAQLRLPPALLASHPQVVLVGRTSGVIALSEATP
ncbi:hypothetical protein [Nocardioides sp. URHA0032]|uniref:hypothetical protein n=1 Tax=Nocardioides sp. URHA0032 TaxID=1380388 RepID=UPI00068888EC|nr:hypothetical protein [Nocardioides sp. URHA0032]